MWSRPFDLLIAALALPLRSFLPVDEAILLAGSLVPPLLLLLCIPLLLRAVSSLRVSPTAGCFALLPFLVHPLLTSEFKFGRADHHALLQTLLVAFCATRVSPLRLHARSWSSSGCF